MGFFGNLGSTLDKMFGGGGQASGAGGTVSSIGSQISAAMAGGGGPNGGPNGGGGGGGQASSSAPKKPAITASGYDPADLQFAVEAKTKAMQKSQPGYSITPEQYIASAVKSGERALSRYMSAADIGGLSERQKLAAAERFTGKGSAGNYLSDADLEFIRSGGGDGLIYSPTRTVDKGYGQKESLSFLGQAGSTEAGNARKLAIAVESGRLSEADLTPEQLKLYQAGRKKLGETRAQNKAEAGGTAMAGPEAAAMESAKKGRKATILTSGQGLLAEDAAALRRRQSLTGGGLIQ